MAMHQGRKKMMREERVNAGGSERVRCLPVAVPRVRRAALGCVWCGRRCGVSEFGARWGRSERVVCAVPGGQATVIYEMMCEFVTMSDVCL
jgi:hypothetical protein